MYSISLLIGLLFGGPASAPPPVSDRSLASVGIFSVPSESEATVELNAIPDVPFYSQFEDIHRVGWQKIGCGIASLAMIIEYYHPDRVSVDTLLARGIDAGAYATNAGWKHRDLALLGGQYGLEGKSYDLATLDTASAFTQFKESLAAGPVIASVHYEFDPKSAIPHLVVITGIEGDRVYYNDPSARAPGQSISISEFLAAWKKRFITFSPQEITP
jgi:ABC-type bacteriocin/lantibiotic exporter with double-glycine peptidase domain